MTLDEQLRQDLQRLQEELRNTSTVDDESADVLRDLEGHIEEVLERSGEVPYPHRHTLAQHMRDSAEYFEVSHPRLTALLNNVIFTLSNLGI
jgi:gas vesicle protein